MEIENMSKRLQPDNWADNNRRPSKGLKYDKKTTKSFNYNKNDKATSLKYEIRQ